MTNWNFLSTQTADVPYIPIGIDWLSLPKGLNWLDVGCGTGAFTELVIDRCAPSFVLGAEQVGTRNRYVAHIAAQDQIAYARNGPAANRATFRTGDVQSLPFADREFDVAAMALVISFVPDASKAVAQMKRVVKHRGPLYVGLTGRRLRSKAPRGGPRRHGYRRASVSRCKKLPP